MDSFLSSLVRPGPFRDSKPIGGGLDRIALVSTLLVSLALPLPAVAEEGLLPGAMVEEALVVDLRPEGLEQLIQPLLDAIPEDFLVGQTPSQQLVDLWLCTEETWMENLHPRLAGAELEVQSSSAGLELLLTAELSINEAADPAYLVLNGCINDNCAMWMEPAQVEVSLPIRFELAADAEGQPYVDLIYGDPVHTVGEALEAQLRIASCDLTTINGFLYEYLGINLFESKLQEMIEDADRQLSEALAELEPVIEEALSGLWIENSADLNGSSFEYRIEPQSIEHADEGLRIRFGGSVDGGQDLCTAPFDPGVSPISGGLAPLPAPSAFDLKLLAGDELPNQALYALWRSGAFCFVAESFGEMPLTMDILPLLIGEQAAPALSAVFGDQETPLWMRVLPTQLPELRYDGTHDLELILPGLQIELFSHLLDRELRLVALGLDLGLEADLELDSSGALRLALQLQEGSLHPSLDYNELVPALGDGLVANFDGLVQMAMDMVASDLLGEVQIVMPTVAGYGLTQLYLAPEGESLDFLSAGVDFGPSDGGEGSDLSDLGCGLEDSTQGACGFDGSAGALGCDPQALLIESGCSGESGVPGEPGCDVLDAAGLLSCHLGGSARVRLGLPQAFLVSFFFLSLRRRRHSGFHHPSKGKD